MPKISIPALRGLMVLVNVVALGGVAFAAHNFFLGDRGELKEVLAEASEFEPKDIKQGGDKSKIMRSVLNVISAQPPPPPAPKPVTPPPSQLRANGPLDEYVYRGGIIGPQPMAIIAEKEEATTSNRRARPSRSRRSRSTKSKRAAPTNVPKSWHVWVGTNFKGCLIDEIHANEIIYSQGSTRYVLKKETAESRLEMESDGMKLIGKDEDGDVTSARPEGNEPPGQIVTSAKAEKGQAPSSRGAQNRGGKTSTTDDLRQMNETIKKMEKAGNKEAADALRKRLGNRMPDRRRNNK